MIHSPYAVAAEFECELVKARRLCYVLFGVWVLTLSLWAIREMGRPEPARVPPELEALCSGK